MKRTLWSLGLSLATSLAAQAQSPAGPAAALGIPRAASLGTPIPARDSAPGILRAKYAETDQPVLVPTPSYSPSRTPVSPYRLTSDPVPTPMPMPSAPRIDEGKKELLPAPVPGGPSPAPQVDFEAPLFQDAVNAPPFIAKPHFRGSAEYLMWWTNGYSVPALVTTGPAATAGALGQPGVTTLFGNQSINTGLTPGLRAGGEWWFGQCQRWAIDSHFFFLAQSGQTGGFGSSGNPLLARPFFNINDNVQSSELVASPGLLTGGIGISSTTQLWGTDVNLRRRFSDCCGSYIDGLVGYRFLSLNETLSIVERSAQIPPVDPTLPLQGMAYDRFRTTNQFYGSQLGVAMGCVKGRWTVDLRSFVALGETSSILYVNGAQRVVNNNGTTSVTQGGLYALNSNIGRFSRNSFSVVPEFTLNVGYNITQHCRVYVGYNFLYWSNVLRPGSQIDPNLDVNRIPNFSSPTTLTSTHPTVPLAGRDFFAQGMNFGLMLNW